MVNTLFKVAEIEISYKLKFKLSERPQINTSQDAYKVLMTNWSLDRMELLEEFKITLINMGYLIISKDNSYSFAE